MATHSLNNVCILTCEGVIDLRDASKTEMAMSETQKNTPETGKSVEAMRDERTTSNCQESGSRNSMVLTLEENPIIDSRSLPSPGQDQKHDPRSKDDVKSTDALTTGVRAHGEPVSPSKSTSSHKESSHMQPGIHDASEENLTRGRSTSRRHFAGKSANRIWTLPTPTPIVDPDGFEDPICDGFWKNVWVACAVHNVCVDRFCAILRADLWATDRNLSSSVPCGT